MPIKKNPYNVGYSGEDAWRDVPTACTCCLLPVTFRVNRADDDGRRVCVRCTPHEPLEGETPERRAERAEKHEALLRDRVRWLEQSKASHDREKKDARDQVSSALRSRDEYRAVVVDVAQFHLEAPSGACSCSKKNCPTLKALNRSRYAGAIFEDARRSP